MTPQVANLIDALNETLAEQFAEAQQKVAAAEADAQFAKAKLHEIAQSVLAICSTVDFTSRQPDPAANDVDVAPPAYPPPANAAALPIEGKPSKRTSLPDATFLAALTVDWSTAALVRKRLTERDFKVSEGSVYNRLRKLSADYPNEVEATIKPERWRLKAPISANEMPKMLLLPAPIGSDLICVEPTKEPRAFHVPAASNDDQPIVHMPTMVMADCLAAMKSIPSESVQLILADLPYATTGQTFDRAIDLEAVWTEYRRIIEPRGNIVLFGCQPFTNALINSAPDIFKYSLVWDKSSVTGFRQAANKPLKAHEDILVFSRGTNISATRSKRTAIYNPQGVGLGRKMQRPCRPVKYLAKAMSGGSSEDFEARNNCPRSILRFPKIKGKKGEGKHPFSKPVDLLEYLIRTYSHPDAIVLDNTMGGGSTMVAAMRTGRRGIGIEMDAHWFGKATEAVQLEREATISRGVEFVTSEVPADNDNAVAIVEAVASQCLVPACPNQSPHPIMVGDRATLYQGDCLEVMRRMPTGSVDLVVTSPPSNLNMMSNGRKRGKTSNTLWESKLLSHGYASYDDAREPNEYVQWQKDVLNECWRLLAVGGAIFYVHKPRIQNKILQTPFRLNPDLPVRQVIMWEREGGYNHNDFFFTPSHEWITIFAERDFKLDFSTSRPTDVWKMSRGQRNDHPAPFPIELPLTAIQCTSALRVLDPFAGSGTTGVAALRCGRQFTGIELDPGYIEVAKARLDAELRRRGDAKAA
jgi:DNA modification methylase